MLDCFSSENGVIKFVLVRVDIRSFFMMYSTGNYLILALLIATNAIVCKSVTVVDSANKEDFIQVRESRESIKCYGVNKSQLLEPQTQIFGVEFEGESKLLLQIPLEDLTKNSKQSQDFELSRPENSSEISNVTIKPDDNSSSTTTPESSSQSTLETSSTSTSVPQTTSHANGEPPAIGSLTTRRGEAVLCGEGNPNGKSNKNLVGSRIIGGSKTLPGEFPFQVRLNIRSRRGSGICGGVILNERYILTAAHCMTACVSQYLHTATIETTGVHATIGDHSIKSNDGEIDISVEKIIPHEKYDACNFYANDHDIALIKTAEPIEYKFTSDGYGSINRPCMPADKDVPYKDGESVIVSGWGVMRESSGSLSNILRYVEVPIVNVTKCQETYGSRVSNNHVCAGFQSGGKDSCQGDSGGPLVRIIKNRYELVGIVSFGYGCGQPSAPGVYTRVASYIDWIKANL